MAEINRRRSGELIRGVFQVLLRHPDGLRAKEVLRELEALIPPTEFKASNYSNRPTARRYEKIVRCATIAAVKAGGSSRAKGHGR